MQGTTTGIRLDRKKHRGTRTSIVILVIIMLAKVLGSSASDSEVVIYTGAGGATVPRDVVRVRVDPSVTSIPRETFCERKGLVEMELCEGLVEIGLHSFANCLHSITNINIPNTLKRINDRAFHFSLRTPIRLHDGIERIGMYAFAGCIFTNFRIPPLITVIPEYVLHICRSMFSVEIPDNVTEINEGAFNSCYCLRNIAFPPNAVIDNAIFIAYRVNNTISDLLFLFGSEAVIVRELQHRFDELPIHRLVYYQSYHQGLVLQNLISVTDKRSGNQQDCLGMTPLHILACSSVHDLELYRVIVEKYPANLITVDRWGALPLLYLFWGAAPT